MTDELKPCPLCGAKPEMARGMGETWVVCKQCFCTCGGQTDERKINWNTRPIEDALVKALEEIREGAESLIFANYRESDGKTIVDLCDDALALAKGGK